MGNIKNIPAMRWVMRHPQLTAWAVLSAGMVALLIYEAQTVRLELSQWIALIIATILVAGACIWIISWEDADSPEEVAEASAAKEAEKGA